MSSVHDAHLENTRIRLRPRSSSRCVMLLTPRRSPSDKLIATRRLRVWKHTSVHLSENVNGFCDQRQCVRLEVRLSERRLRVFVIRCLVVETITRAGLWLIQTGLAKQSTRMLGNERGRELKPGSVFNSDSVEPSGNLRLHFGRRMRSDDHQAHCAVIR